MTPDLAMAEASRCLMCRRPVCIDGCPVGIRITDFIDLVANGEFDEAAKVIKQDNSLPAICGRVCPQENQCEGACVLARKDKAIAIGALERFVADFERDNELMTVVTPAERTDKRVAVVGSGPSGLACATDLARLGHDVTVFEALHELGGVLVYGIPEFRLPKEIVRAEIAQLEAMGVEFVTNAVIGMIDSIDDLLGEEGYDAVFLGVGAGLPAIPTDPGRESHRGVFRQRISHAREPHEGLPGGFRYAVARSAGPIRGCVRRRKHRHGRGTNCGPIGSRTGLDHLPTVG